MGSYRVEIDNRARDEIRHLPGHMRQRVMRVLRELEHNPRPYTSETLNTTKLDLPATFTVEPRRIRLDPWRIVYVIEEEFGSLLVLTVRRRPPYRYEDLEALLKDLG